MSQILEEKAVGAGTVTFQGLEALIKTVMTSLGVPQVVEALKGAAPASVSSSSSSSSASQLVAYDGRLHRVPADFLLPRGTMLHAWQLFVCGEASKGYPPLKQLKPVDIGSNKNKRKRFSDYTFVMGLISQRVKEEKKWINNPSITEANAMFAVGDAAFSSVLPEFASAAPPHIGRKRKRSGQMRWTTIAKLPLLAKKPLRKSLSDGFFFA